MKRNRISALIWLVLAVCCACYGLMIMRIRSGTKFYAVWYGLGAVCAVLAAAAGCGMWEKLSKGIRKVVSVILCICLAVFITAEGFILSGFGSEGEKNLDYLIVLGAQVKEDGPSYVLKRRLDKALEYLEDNPQTVCIVAGGQGYNEPFPEAEGMADYLMRMGLPETRILQERDSSSTEENILNSMRFIPEGSSVGVVTNNFHVFRAVRTAKRLGLENVCGLAADMRPVFLPNSMLREFLAVMKFAITGI